MNLKVSLVLRVAAVALATSCAVGYLFLNQLVAQNARDVERVAQIAERHVGFQVVQQATGMGMSAHFPDWRPLQEDADLHGLCVAYRSAAGRLSDTSCVAQEVGRAPAPLWFAALVRLTLDYDAASARPVGYFAFAQGEVVVRPLADAAIDHLWVQARVVLQLLAANVVLVSALAWVAVGGALRPTGEMLARLARMADGDLTIRLPDARISELNAIVAAVNRLSLRLQATLAERADLARRLVDAHEGERRSLARELHDELAQCLSGINAKAALIAQKARRLCPELVADTEAILAVNLSTLVQLREMLVRLRPPEFDELGLAESLRGLVAKWSGAHPQIAVGYSAEGGLSDLAMPVSVSLYRIAQECLTNVARHAGATRVDIAIARHAAGEVELRVADNGRGVDLEAAPSGFGLVGMRERVAALDGTIGLQTAADGGLTVTVRVPARVQAAPAPSAPLALAGVQ